MFSVQRISTLPEFARIRSEWNSILQVSGSDNIHLRHEWLSAWAETLGRGKELCVLKINDGSETIGFAPLMVNPMRWRKFVPYKQLLFLSDPWSDFGDFIIARDHDAAVRSVFDYLTRHEDWGEILLHDIPETSPNFPAFQSIVADRGDLCELAPKSPCYFITMKGRSWEEFYPTTHKNFVRKDITRLSNHYTGHQWEIKEFDGATLPQMMDACTRLHQASQSRKGRETFYTNAGFQSFLDTFRSQGELGGWMKGYLLEIDRQPAAFVLGFDYHRKYYYWNIGLDSIFEKLSPSKFLLYNILRSGFEDDRWDEFNFMRGATDYKRRWTSSSYDLFQLRLLNTGGLYGTLNRLRNSRRAVAVATVTD